MKAVFLDLETNPDRADVSEHEIIEIGAIRFGDHGQQEFQTLVRPTRPVVPDVLELTGIGEKELAAAPELADVLRSSWVSWVIFRRLPTTVVNTTIASSTVRSPR